MDDEAVDALYELPLDEFVAARNALAKERKDKALRSLRKPSVPAWAVNQLARRHGSAVEVVIDSAEALRKAQRRALSGGGGDALRAATRAHRQAVDDAMTHLRSVVPGPTAATVERVRATLTAASIDDSLVGDLRAGRLVDDVEPAGFGDVTGLELLTLDEAGSGGDDAEAEPEPDPRAEEREAARAELADARARQTEAEKALTSAERALRDAEVRADEAAADVREAERALRRAEKRLTSLGGDVGE